MADVSVSVGATLGELRKGLDDAGKLVGDFQKKSSQAKGAANALAQGIEAIGGASNGAAKMAGNLLSGFAIGGPMGLAVAGVNALVQFIQAAKKEEEELKKKADETAKAYAERARQFGATLQASRERVHSTQVELELAKAETESEKERIRGRERLYAIDQRIKEVKASDLSSAQKATELQYLAREIEATKALNVQLQREVDLKEQAERAALAKKPTAAALPAGLDRPLAPATNRGDDRRNMDFTGVFGNGTLTDDAQQKQYEQFMKPAIGEAKKFADAQRDAEEATRELQDSAVAMGSSFGTAFAGMASGSMTAREAFTQMGTSMMSTLLQLVAKQITANAAGAASGAASSQASIPVVGPALAVAAMTAMLGTVMGLLGNLPSAAGGMLVPHDMLAEIHKDERLLPARYSRGLDRMVDDAASGHGRRGGPAVVVNGPMDGVSVYRTLTRADREVRRTLDRMTRRRR